MLLLLLILYIIIYYYYHYCNYCHYHYHILSLLFIFIYTIYHYYHYYHYIIIINIIYICNIIPYLYIHRFRTFSQFHPKASLIHRVSRTPLPFPRQLRSQVGTALGERSGVTSGSAGHGPVKHGHFMGKTMGKPWENNGKTMENG